MIGTRPDELLRPYVPVILIDWLRNSPAARHRAIDGSLAFVDISGFTTLTERLTRRGKEGSEEISDTLDDCFKQLLDVAYRYGAGVVKWGGDAVLILFTGDGHVERACAAALGMQQTMRRIGRLRTSAGVVLLRTSIGIHSGTFHFFLAGELHRELVLAGAAAGRTAAMESAAGAGEVVVSAETAALLEPRLLGDERGNGRLLKRAPSLAAAPPGPAPDTTGLPLEECFSPLILEHLLAGRRVPEHRLVTSAFVAFDGVEELIARGGAATAADALHESLTNVQAAAAEHEVAFFDSDIYGSGGKILLVAGCPRSTGSNEERMLRTLRRVLDTSGPLPLRAGANRGRVFADDFGPPYRRTYSVKGDSVNLAARLMAKAQPGRLLATDETVARSRTHFALTRLEPFAVKGKAEPVSAAEVGAIDGSAHAQHAASDAPFVGRELELDDLAGRLERARGGLGSFVEIAGPAGIGKSRLVHELRVRADGARVVAVAAEEYEAATPYYAVGLLLRDALGAPTSARALATRVAAAAPKLLPWLPLLALPLRLETPTTPESEQLDGELRRTKLEEVVSSLLAALLDGPALLVFEDAQWLDEASGSLLRRLAQDAGTRPWLIVSVRRDDEPAGDALALQPLASPVATTLVHALTEARPLPAHRVQQIVERAGGNPLFLAEFAREDELSDSLEELVTAQIDRLATTDRLLLRHASILGRSFDEHLLAASFDEPVDDIAWARLSAFVSRERGVVRFRQSVVRDAAYEGLPFRLRREMHGRVGEAIAKLWGEDAAERLSLHFFHAHRHEEAWRYSRIAAARAEEIYANAEAAELYGRAVVAARAVKMVGPDVAGVYEALGDVQERLGLFDDAAGAYREARRRRGGDPVAEAALMRKEGWVTQRRGRYPAALRWYRRGLGLLEAVPGQAATSRRAELLTAYAVVRQMQGRPTDATAWCRAAIAEAERAGDRSTLAHAYQTLDWALVELGRGDEAIFSPRALAIYEELGALGRQAVVLNAMAAFAYWAGRWDEAVELNERAVGVYEIVGDPTRRADCIGNIAEIRCDQNRLDEAQASITEALRAWRAAGWTARIAGGTRLQAVILLRGGDAARALELLEEARTAFLELGVRSEANATEVRIAECLLALGKTKRALDLARDAATAIGQGGVYEPFAQRVLGQALLERGQRDAAAAALEQSLDAGRRLRASYEVALTLDAMARHDAERDAIRAELGILPAPPGVVTLVSG